MTAPTISSLLYPNHPRIVMHTELSINDAEQPRPFDQTRSPGYDLHKLADVQALLARAAELGVTDIMPNTYGLQENGQPTPEQVALELFFQALPATKIGLIINIDKGLYATKPSPIAAIQAYLLYLREKAFPLANYQKFNGEYVVTYFCLPTDSPAMFAQIEEENHDIRFVYNDLSVAPKVAALTGKGENTMGWIVEGLDVALDQYCGVIAKRPQTELHIPFFSPGFNDTLMRNGKATSVWSPPTIPARVWGPPSFDVLERFFAVLRKYYEPSEKGVVLSAYKPTWIQGVTLNDCDEGTMMETPANGPNPYFGNVPPPPPPVTITHGEVWDGPNKLGDLTLGAHTLTLQQVQSDGSVVAATKQEVPYSV